MYCLGRYGDHRHEVLSKCGEPVARDNWFIPGDSFLYYRHRRPGTVLVEEWIYAFDSNRFRRFVSLVDGRVVAIQTGEKGD